MVSEAAQMSAGRRLKRLPSVSRETGMSARLPTILEHAIVDVTTIHLDILVEKAPSRGILPKCRHAHN
jgi:hypothetical protein